MKDFLKKHKEVFVALASALGTAGVMYAIWGTVFVLISFLVVAIHELGHILAAKKYDADVGYTFFIPLVLGILGATQITNIPKDKAGIIAIAGPIFGLVVALAMLAIVIAFGFTALFVPMITLVAFELFNLFLGSDAKKYRKARTEK